MLEGGHTSATPPYSPSTKEAYGFLNRADLKAEAARRGLMVSGTKTEIAERLLADDEERSE